MFCFESDNRVLLKRSPLQSMIMWNRTNREGKMSFTANPDYNVYSRLSETDDSFWNICRFLAPLLQTKVELLLKVTYTRPFPATGRKLFLLSRLLSRSRSQIPEKRDMWYPAILSCTHKQNLTILGDKKCRWYVMDKVFPILRSEVKAKFRDLTLCYPKMHPNTKIDNPRW